MMGLEHAKGALKAWAQAKPFIRRVMLYGIRFKGAFTSDSDLDVAIEFDAVGNDPDCLTTWTSEGGNWQRELRSLIPYRVHLEWYDPQGDTPTVETGLKEGCEVLYERPT